MSKTCPTPKPGLWPGLPAAACLLAAACLATVGVLAPGPSLAQIDGPHVELSVLAGQILPDDALDMESAPMLSLRGGLYPSARLGLELLADFAPSERTSNPDLAYDYSFFGARAVVNISPVELVAPYVFGGAGVTVLGLEYESDPKASEPGLSGHLGAGLRAHLTRTLALRAEVRGLFTGFEDFSIQNAHFGLGLSVSFGRDSDKDQDGVTDSNDHCPQTPAGAEVDWRGCPYDDDVDGVPNGLDLCPDTPMPATVDSKGCEVEVPTLERRRR